MSGFYLLVFGSSEHFGATEYRLLLHTDWLIFCAAAVLGVAVIAVTFVAVRSPVAVYGAVGNGDVVVVVVVVVVVDSDAAAALVLAYTGEMLLSIL